MDPDAPIGETMHDEKNLIVYNLKLEFRGFIVALQGWLDEAFGI